MYYPLRGERVWVSGCRDEFIVLQTDHTTCKAVIALVSDNGAVREGVSFRLLFSFQDFAAAQEGAAGPRQVLEVLRSSHIRIHRGQAHVHDSQETLRASLSAIERSQALISRTDQAVARWQTLNCKASQSGTVSGESIGQTGRFLIKVERSWGSRQRGVLADSSC